MADSSTTLDPKQQAASASEPKKNEAETQKLTGGATKENEKSGGGRFIICLWPVLPFADSSVLPRVLAG